MAKDNLRRIPFVLNLADPVDGAIWEALQPMLERRASQFIRGAVAHALGVSGLLPPIGTPALPAAPSARLELPVGPVPRARRPARKARLEPEPLPHDNGHEDGALDEATGNFLNMFG